MPGLGMVCIGGEKIAFTVKGRSVLFSSIKRGTSESAFGIGVERHEISLVLRNGWWKGGPYPVDNSGVHWRINISHRDR